jgi:AcrR family transcriptional regulator
VSVFGRLGYTQASIDLIAAEAGVSTRTIYNHFENKLAFFVEVLVASATEVANAFISEVDAKFTATDVEADVTALAKAIVAHRQNFPAHFALLRRIGAEADQLPRAVVDSWLDAGPRRVREALVARLRELDAAALISVPDPSIAARHLVALASNEMLIEPGRRELPPTDADLEASVGVFLRGYARHD